LKAVICKPASKRPGSIIQACGFWGTPWGNLFMVSIRGRIL
jgi:hypothetical protein